MEALDLIMLGRRLVKIGEEAMRGSKNPGMPTGASVVLRDVFANPDSSITDITARTGLPQSYVSECIAKLRDGGIVDTTVDPADRRRTLARVSAEHPLVVARKGAVSVDAGLAQALGKGEPAADEVTQWLVALAKRLAPAEPGPILRQITAASR
jgi:MarR family